MTSSPASSRERFARLPVNTKLFPASFWLFTTRFSAVGCTPALRSFLMSWQLAGSEKNSTMRAATFGPTSGTSSSSSSFPAANSSSEEKCSASNCAVLANKLNAQRVNQPRQRILFARLDFLKQVLRGLFRHALQPGHFAFLQ